jgi:hypothetical protein
MREGRMAACPVTLAAWYKWRAGAGAGAYWRQKGLRRTYRGGSVRLEGW